MEEKSFLHLIPILWRHKYLILISVITAGILTSIIMLLRPDYYRSYTIFYPVNNSLLDPSVQINEKAIDYYGDDRDVDRLLSMAHSAEIAQKIIRDFDLAGHYKIKVGNNKGKIRLNKRFNKLYNIKKTEYDAIELSVEDRDPKMAKDLTDAVTQYIDQKAKDIVQGSQRRLLNNLKTSFTANHKKLNSISDSLKVMREKFGIYSTESQAEALATMEVNSPGNITLRNRINNYSAGISIVTNLEAQQEELNEGLNEDALQIQQLESILAANSSAIHIIESAYVPIEKSWPRRSLYVLGAMFLTGFFVKALILIRENLKSINTA